MLTDKLSIKVVDYIIIIVRIFYALNFLVWKKETYLLKVTIPRGKHFPSGTIIPPLATNRGVST